MVRIASEEWQNSATPFAGRDYQLTGPSQCSRRQGTNRGGWSRTPMVGPTNYNGQAMTTARCALHELRPVIVELQAVGLHSVSERRRRRSW